MDDKQTCGKYTLEFKQEAVRQVKAGRAAAVVVAKTLGMPKANLSNWVRMDSRGELEMVANGRPVPVVTPEQAEIVRRRAENARLKMERDTAKRPPWIQSVAATAALKSTGRHFVVQRLSRPRVQAH
jgi:transposase